MRYIAKNVDSEKALKYIEESRRYQDRAKTAQVVALEKYYEGIQKGLDVAEEIFTCANCEGKGLHRESAKETIYEIAKELDVNSQDIRDSDVSIDEMCSMFADRIRSVFEESEVE